MRIDSHHHFWKYNPEEFAWIDESMESIKRNFLPEDLHEILEKNNIDGTISVQARQKTEETEWLLEIAEEYDFIKGVVGWVPLTELRAKKDLERFSISNRLKGTRHVLHDEPDDNYMLRDDFNQGIGLLRDYDLVFDILIFEKHLPQTIQFVDRHPEQIFVLDHIGKPAINEGLDTPWRKFIPQLAERENVFCKLSGLVTEADYQNWTKEQLVPYMEIVTEVFWPKRIMFGSDWPVCTVAAEYNQWLNIVCDFIESFSQEEQDRILGDTAQEVYKISE